MTDFDKKPSHEEMELHRTRPAGIQNDPRGAGLEPSTEFGKMVVSATGKPTPPITIDGQPMDQFVAHQRTPLIESEFVPTSLFDTPTKDKGPARSVIANAAFEENMALNGTYEEYEARKIASMDGLVVDEALKAFSYEQMQQNVPVSPMFDPEVWATLSLPKQAEVLALEKARIDLQKMQPRHYALIFALEAGLGDAPLEEWEKAYSQMDPSELMARKEYQNRMYRRAAFSDLNQYVAGAGWANIPEAVVNVAFQDFTPIYPLISRWGLTDGIAEAAGVEGAQGWGSFWLGSGRQKLREAFLEMTPTEFAQAGSRIIQYLNEEAKDPFKAALITKYGVLELMEAVFTEDVIDGISAENKWDLYGGNVETALEGLFSFMVLAKVGTTAARAFSRGGEVSVTNTARASGRPDVASRVESDLQTDEISWEFNIMPDEAVGDMLPRPSVIYETDVIELVDGTKSVIVRSERTASRVIETVSRQTGAGLTPADKARAIQKAYDDLNINDGAYVHGRMNELAMHEDGSGYRMKVVIGENAEGGYHNIVDALDEALDIDPSFQQLQIFRVNGSGVLEPIFESPTEALRAFTTGEVDAGTAGRIAGGDNPDETFYLVHDRDNFWNPIDKEILGPETFQSGYSNEFLVAPNARFGKEFYTSIAGAHLDEQLLRGQFEVIFKPYFDLGAKDKRFVNSAFEWMEDFGKNNGRPADLAEIKAQFPHITPKQTEGLLAHQIGMDTLHHALDLRLHRQGVSLNWKTARPVAGDDLPLYHGKVLDERTARQTAEYYDPVEQKMVKINAAEMRDLYNHGGGIMELDVPLEVGTRSRATRIVMNRGDYEIGDLSERLLDYHPGYHARTYDDPYIILKDTDGVSMNGKVPDGQARVLTEAIRTAGSSAEAARFVRRANFRNEKRGIEGETFRVQRAKDLDQSESTIFNNQVFHREGRLFWDRRNFDALPDVNGNRAVLEDPNISTERLIGQAARQLTHEDMLRGIKDAWKNDFGDLIQGTKGGRQLLENMELGEISDRLKKIINNSAEPLLTKRAEQARGLIDYLRLLDGTQDNMVPWIRRKALGIAVAMNKWMTKGGQEGAKGLGIAKSAEKWAMEVDPFKAMRSIAFKVFLAWRPARQALLQSAQIGYLAGLDPLYVMSPKLWTDAAALRRGVRRLRDSGYDDGYSTKGMSGMMGLKEKEYRVLVREFERSGLIDSVSVHSFAGGAPTFKKTKLPTEGSTLGTVGYKAKQGGAWLNQKLQDVGFNWGEKNNLTFTYNLALRRVMKRNDYDSLLRLTKKDWDDLRVEASNLALGMLKPNAFRYQSGALGVTTQFFSFSHKALLGMIGKHPNITRMDGLRIAIGGYLLYGANIFGARDMVTAYLQDIGVPDQVIGDTGLTIVDIISGGLIDNLFNVIGNLTVEEWADIDTEFIAPGFNFARFYDMTLRNIVEQPYKAAFGPFGNIASKTMTAFDFAYVGAFGDPDGKPVDKFLASAVVAAEIIPVLNDQVKAYLGWKMGIWYTQAHEPLAIRATWNGMIARSLFGARTRAELANYEMQSNWWEQDEAYNNTVKVFNEYYRTQITLFNNGKASAEDVKRRLAGAVNLMEDLPQGVGTQFVQDVFNGIQQNDLVQESVYSVIMKEGIGNQRRDSSQFDHLYDDLQITEQERAELIELSKEAQDTRRSMEQRLKEEAENGN